MRWLLVLALVACSSSNTPPDAFDPCGAPAPPSPSASCVRGALAGDALEGTWSYTGTTQYTRYDGTTTTQDVSGTMTLHRDGTGWCSFYMNGGRPTLAYVNDDFVSSPSHAESGHVYEARFSICQRGQAGTLFYESYVRGGELQPSYPQYTSTTTMVLTR